MKDNINRQIALEWWNNLSFERQCMRMIEAKIDPLDRTPESLTGREIESLCPKHLLNENY